jgi:hypothetical protein
MRFVAVLSLALALACSKQHPGGGLPAGAAELLRDVPADTPYLFATLEPLPREYLERTLVRGRESLQNAVLKLDALGARGHGQLRLLVAFAEELGPEMSVAGLERIGIGAGPRSVFYGIGLLPALRVEIKDPAALAAFLERVMARGGGPAAQVGPHGKHWDFAFGGWTATIAVTGRELLATTAPAELLPQVLARLHGETHDGPSLDQTSTVGELFASYGFRSKSFIGYIDFARLAAALTDERRALDRQVLVRLGFANQPVTQVCRDEVAGLVAHVPRMVLGFDELTGGRTRGTLTFEVDPGLARELLALRTPAPAVGMPLGTAIATIGAALDVPAGVELLRRHARAVLAQPYRCAPLTELNEAAADLDRTLSEPLPAPFADLRGFAAVLQDFEGGSVPLRLRAAAVLTATDPIHLMSLAKRYSSMLPGLVVAPNGKPVPLPLGPLLSGFVAIQGRLLGVAVGEGSDLEVVRVMSERPLVAEPIFAAAYDMDRLQRALADVGGLFSDRHQTPLGLHGKIAMVAELVERGVVVRMLLEEP